MSSSTNSHQRELMFCHQCDNEFWKDEHGLECPQCQSEFIEVIEGNSHPRRASTPPIPPHPFYNQGPPVPRHPLESHNPWPAPDPDEGDIRQYEYHSPDGHQHFSFQTTVITSSNNGGITRRTVRSGGLPQFGPFGMFGSNGRSRSAEPRHGQLNTADTAGNFHNNSHFHATFGGPGMMFPTVGGRGMQQQGGATDMQRMMVDIVSILTGRPAMGDQGDARGGQPFLPPNIAELLNGLMNPANLHFGDAVGSDEALDRIITQLMEQHQSGNAPGPASAAAIDALPKMPATTEHLGEEGKADCSICMDEVTAGVVITKLPCSHWFHPDCVNFWLKEHDTCPVCRSGITAKDGSRDEVRQPAQAPLHNEDPVHVARRQSGSRAHPFIVPESPSRERRQPNFRSNSGGSVLEPIEEPCEGGESSQRQGGGGGGGGIMNRVRNLLGGGHSSSQPSPSPNPQSDQAPH